MEVRLWTFELDLDERLLHTLRDTLSDDERERSNRYRREIDRRRFVAGRGLTRRALASLVDAEPADLRFATELLGRPRLVTTGDSTDWRFSFSRSGGRGVLAATVGRATGVDIEAIEALPDLVSVAATAFAPGELVYWKQQPPGTRLPTFYRIWTRKEAIGKAAGSGLTPGVQAVTAPTANIDRGMAVLHDRWILSDVPGGARWQISLALESPTDGPIPTTYTDTPIDAVQIRRSFGDAHPRAF